MSEGESGNRRQLWFGIVVSAICLAAIFYFIRPQEILESLRTARYDYLIFGALGILTFLLMRAVRWRFLLNNDAPWLTIFHIQNIGYLVSTVLPFRLGDVARAVLIGNVPPITISRGISTMVVERVLDMLFIVTLLPFTLASIAYLPEWMRLGARASGIMAITAIIVLIVAANRRDWAVRFVRRILNVIPLLNSEAWARRTDSFLGGLNKLTRFKDGALLLLLTVVAWLPIIFAYYTTMLAANLDPTIVMASFVVCAAALSVALPSSPGQIGVFHAGVIAALQVWGQPDAASASFAFLYHALNSVLLITMGVAGILGTGSTFRQVVVSTQNFLRRQEQARS
jgi:uncharacterized protein (TIRG00374 family)